MNDNKRIEWGGEVCGGRARVAGTRLSVEFLLALKAQGWTDQHILTNYPNLAAEDLRAVFAFGRDTVHEGHYCLLADPADRSEESHWVAPGVSDAQ